MGVTAPEKLKARGCRFDEHMGAPPNRTTCALLRSR
jgi:hypothetical protein